MGFREVPHTADVALEVWAPDLSGLFAEAARGLNSISGVALSPGRPVSRPVHLEELDDEGLLVAFLTEVVYAQEQDRLGFDEFRLEIEAHRLRGEMSGRPIATIAKPIKAVTYHNLRITSNASGLRVLIVFDV